MKKTPKKLVLNKETVAMLLQVTGGGPTQFCFTAVCSANDSCPCTNAQYAC
jgi:hypothetical protein